MTEEQVQAWSQQLQIANTLADLGPCQLVIEAVVERLEVKQALFAELERTLPANVVWATNTSSLSVTAIAAALQQPERLAGFHFFNPVPLMKVVEVVAGLKTDPALCQALTAYAREMGAYPVQAQDTPGFIVNHAGRGFGTEALRIVSEGVADFATIDRILRDQVGFKLGPFELILPDGTGRVAPRDGIHLPPVLRRAALSPQRHHGTTAGRRGAGQESGRWLLPLRNGVAQVPAEPPVPVVQDIPPVWVSPERRDAWSCTSCSGPGRHHRDRCIALTHCHHLGRPLGFDVTTVAVVERLDPARTIGIDMLVEEAATKRRVLATNPATRVDIRNAAHALFARDGKPVSVIRDSGGFVTQRVVATIVNIAADICQQGICSPKDLETAVTLGLGYPLGPLAMGDRWGPTNILEVLFNMQTVYGDTRYRPSPWLRRGRHRPEPDPRRRKLNPCPPNC